MEKFFDYINIPKIDGVMGVGELILIILYFLLLGGLVITLCFNVYKLIPKRRHTRVDVWIDVWIDVWDAWILNVPIGWANLIDWLGTALIAAVGIYFIDRGPLQGDVFTGPIAGGFILCFSFLRGVVLVRCSKKEIHYGPDRRWKEKI